ncbi:MAG: ankyrin repeat domain-containing protein [Puniceicoccales bacterium]|jgi:ankyrin repeat protein|nr:ankyrin repeat domain-containing protein [Puniceicoccales bacterium]
MKKFRVSSLLLGTFLMPVVSYGAAVAKQSRPHVANEAISYKGFFSAIENGNIEKVNRYLDRGANVNARMEEVEYDHGGLFTHYLSPLVVAIRSGRIDMVRLLLARGANVNTEGGNVNVPLYAAVETWNPDMVRLLLEQKGIDVNVSQNVGMSCDQVDDLGLRGEPYNFQVPKTALRRAEEVAWKMGRDSESAQIAQLLSAKGAW